MEIPEEKFNEVKNRAVKFFKENRKINSPAFGKIKITPEGFDHIEWKKRLHKRSIGEAFVRYLCFLHIEYILSNSKLYQEYRNEIQRIEIKKDGKKIKQDKVVSLYGFIAIVNGNKHRVKIVVKKVEGWGNYEFVSVIPFWKGEGYSRELFFDNEENFLNSLEFKELKKTI